MLSSLLSYAKSTAKALPYPFRLRLMQAAAIPSELAEQRGRYLLGIPPLSTMDPRALRKSDTIFILGSGASINDIEPERWSAIGAHDSLGFNFWFLHSFVPTLYSTKAFNPAHFPPEHVRWGYAVRDRFLREARLRSDAYRDVPKILMHISDDTLSMVQQLPEGFRHRAFTVSTASGVAFNEHELCALLRHWRKQGLFEPSRRITAIPKYRSSVTQLVSLAVVLGYRKIVLCGIDLTHARYFYQDADRYPRFRDFSGSPPMKVHITNTRTAYSLDAVTVLRTLRTEVLKPMGVELFVEHESSGLYPDVPVAPPSVYAPPEVESRHY